MSMQHGYGAATGINHTQFTQIDRGPGRLGSTHDVDRTAEDITAALANYYNRKDSSRAMSLDTDIPTYTTVPRTTRSLSDILNGQARVIRARVAAFAATRPDPVKAILAVEFTDKPRHIIITPQVTGGGAIPVSERVSARLVSTSAKATEIFLVRIGVDVAMNLNGIHQPTVFLEELRLKLAAQQVSVENYASDTGCAAILREGTSFEQACLRNDPLHGTKTGKERLIAADRIHADMFASINAYEFPIPNIIAGLSAAGVNTPVGGVHSSNAVLLVPPGPITIAKYTRPSNMHFSVSGISLKDNVKGLVVPLQDVVEDTTYGMKILTLFPRPDFTRYDSSNPQVTKNQLARDTAIAMYYELDESRGAGRVPVHDFKITDFKSRSFYSVNVAAMRAEAVASAQAIAQVPTRQRLAPNDIAYVLLRPRMVLSTASIVYCSHPGKESGMIMMMAPQTGVCIDRSTEELKVPMRVYVGSGLTCAENVIVMNDVQSLGIKSGHGRNYTRPDTRYEFGDRGTDLIVVGKRPETQYEDLLEDDIFLGFMEMYGLHQHYVGVDPDLIRFPMIPYQGAMFEMNGETRIVNAGHLKNLDHPSRIGRLENRQVYDDHSK